ncbi:MAG: VCBS repeat-containing protein [Flavobacteriales bacterium]|nr:VCBS repeat-containing protein [Flavobacteriales bacterium]
MKIPFFTTLFLITLVSSGQAQIGFTESSSALGINHSHLSNSTMGGGVAVLDYNNDGWEDLFLTGGLRDDGLYKNNGNGTFSLATGLGDFNLDNLESVGVITGDIDNDGYPEIFITTMWYQPNIFLYNNGDGTFTDISISSNVVSATDSNFSTSAAFGDINNDGYIDLYIGNYVYIASLLEDSLGVPYGYDHTCSANSLFLNNGNLTFSEISNAAGVGDAGCALAITLTDFDNDNDVDILLANDFGSWVLPSALFENDYATSSLFNDISVSSGTDFQMYGMGIAIADYDHDMDLDYYITNIGNQILMCNMGNSTFEDTANYANVRNEYLDTVLTTGWGTAFFDINNDTYQDLFVAHGFIQLAGFFFNAEADPDKAYLNNGDGTFSDITDSVSMGDTAQNRGLAYSDFNQDGLVDLIICPATNDTTSPDHVDLYQNISIITNNYAQVKLVGTVSNRDAFGSHIQIYVNGDSWVEEITGGSSHMSQNSSIAHFGLGSATIIDSLIITWPSGITEKKLNVAANQRYEFIEGAGNTNGIAENQLKEIVIFPNPSKDILNIRGVLSHPLNELRIYDICGNLAYSGALQNSIDVSFLSAGSYILVLTEWNTPSRSIIFNKL